MYKITTSYNWYKTAEQKIIIKTYYINHTPFTFDEIPTIAQEDPEIIQLANNQLMMTPNIFYQKSFYLIDEEAHPCFFPVELENPEDMPDDIIEYDEGDLTS
jgi:hypothetical protein